MCLGNTSRKNRRQSRITFHKIMNLSSFESRRIETCELIRRGMESKLIRGHAAYAEEILRQAYNLASEKPTLPGPLIQLTAYRIAHLILRGSSTVDRLEEAERLLDKASEGNRIGPLPAIYRLAVLGRLHQARKMTYRDEILRKAFHKALDAVRAHCAVPQDSHGNRRVQKTRIQDHYFNMLELSSYFLDLCRNDLDGLGIDPYTDLSPTSDAWVLVGPDKKITEVLYSRELALVELEDRGRIFPEAVLFKRSADPNGYVWKYSGSDWQETRTSGAEYLAFVLSRRLTSKEDLRRKVCSTDSGDNLRQVKSRLLRDLDALTGREGSLIIVDDPETRMPEISHESVIVFGAVPWSLIR